MSGMIPSLHNALMQRFDKRPLNNDLIAQMTEFIHRHFADQEVKFEASMKGGDTIDILPLNIYTGLLFIGQTPDSGEVALKTTELNGTFHYENEFGRYALNGSVFNFYPNDPIDYIKVEVKVCQKQSNLITP